MSDDLPAPVPAVSAQTPSPATAPPAAHGPAAAGAGGDVNWAWNVLGAVFGWIFLMALLQKGLRSGYLFMVLALYVVVGVVVLKLLVQRLLQRYPLPLLGIGFLALWAWLGGSYSWRRDAALTLAVTFGVLWAHPQSRTWLRRLPARWRAWRRLRERNTRRQATDAARARRAATSDALKAGLVRFGRRTWDAARAPTPPAAPRLRPAAPRRRLAPAAIATAAVAVWCALSGADWLFERTPLARDGDVLRPAAMPAAYAPLHVGLALSGGGYRAALVHAGVVDALGQLGVPVTHLSSVSGGSIVAAYLSQGGSPRAFRDAVAAGRFRMTRDLFAVQNLVRLPSPGLAPGLNLRLWPFFDRYSRLDVQAGLVDRVLLRGAEAAARAPGPALMVCMTDLTYGFSVGALDDGFLFAGPSARRYFRAPDAIDLPELRRLADRVAVSGAFPGAFPPLQVTAHIVTDEAPLSEASAYDTLSLMLADGGVRDNLGLNLLEAADALAREGTRTAPVGGVRDAHTLPPDWALDLILVSDGGKFLEAETGQGVLSTMMRAIDLSGLETGVLRTVRRTAGQPVVVLSALGTLAPSPDAAVFGRRQTALRDAGYAYFRPDALDADVLDKLVALVPDHAAARSAHADYLRTRSTTVPSVAGLAARCPPQVAGAASTAECAWWRLVSLVGADIWRTAETFMRTPTLADAFAGDDADALFRFGQYIALLQAPQIRRALVTAAQQRGTAASVPAPSQASRG